MPDTDNDAGAPRGLGASAPPRRQSRGKHKREQLVQACANVMLRDGPAAVTHRAVAQQAGMSLASTTYYFQSLDEMIEAAGVLLAADWVRNAASVVAELAMAGESDRADAKSLNAQRVTAAMRADLLVRAVLPPGDDGVVRSHYEHLVGAGRSASLAAGYAQARADFDAVIGQLLLALGLREVSPAAIVALVDGGAVAALSEGRPVRAHAQALLGLVIQGVDSSPGRGGCGR